MVTEQEFAEMLADPTKEIVGDIRWTLAPGYRGSQRFTAAVGSTPDRGLRVYGWRKPASAALGYHVIHPSAGRVVGVCLGPGVVHHGPLCDSTGVSKLRCDCPRGVHKHRWTEQFGDQWVYVPPDITADAGDPSEVWRQFCAEINLTHRGILHGAEGGTRW